jgi:DNA-binding NarL/FixJ family response regulator
MAAEKLERADPPPGSERRLEVVLLALHPVLQRGLGVVLTEAGFDVADAAGVSTWTREGPRRLVVTVDEDASLHALEDLQARVPGLLSVVLLAQTTTWSYARALARCTSAVPVDAELEDLVAAVRAASRECAVLPTRVAQQLASGMAPDEAAPVLNEQQAGWLRELVNGATVTSLARSAGYSEREMYRLLSALYARLGVTTRTEALLRADRWGLLRHRPSQAPVVDLAGYERSAGFGPRR